jgi:hypothetical protein
MASAARDAIQIREQAWREVSAMKITANRDDRHAPRSFGQFLFGASYRDSLLAFWSVALAG